MTTEFHGLLIIMVVIWVAGKIFRSLSLPVIFGELLGGILVGPLVFNMVSPDSELIKVLAELGIFFLMLHSGLETDPSQLIKSSKKSLLIAIGGFLLPFVGAYFISRGFGLEILESLFMALGVSVTAIAISIRVFKEYKLQNTKIANTVLGAAIISDIIILVLFSIITSLSAGEFSLVEVAWLIAKITFFFGIIIIGGFKTQKYFKNLFKDKGFTLTFIIALALGLAAEQMGLHMVIGAFLAGLFIREEVVDEKVFRKIEDRIYGLSYSFLAPVFFASLAFNLDFKGLFAQPLFFLALFITAYLGKLIGSAVMTKIQNFSNKDSLIVGLAMNSRGAVDLIIASIGLQMGIIKSEMFSMLVIIAFSATLLTIFALKPFKSYLKSLSSNLQK